MKDKLIKKYKNKPDKLKDFYIEASDLRAKGLDEVDYLEVWDELWKNQ